MTFDQIAAFSILGGMIVLFVWNRLRYDVVAMLGLLAAVAVGVVPVDKAFTGFSDQIVIIVGSALVLSAAISQSGIIEAALRPVAPYMKSTAGQIAVLGTTVAVLSAFVKNIGALAAFLPVAIQMARRSNRSPSRLLMPMAFAALLGGLSTLIGTSPNIIVSRMRAEIVGEPFRMFDFAPVGVGLTVCGLLFLVVGWRLLPARNKAPMDAAFEVGEYTTEVRIPAGSPYDGKSVADLQHASEDSITVSAILREESRRYVPSEHWRLYAEDVLTLVGDTHALKSIVDHAKLDLVGQKPPAEGAPKRTDVAVVEAVVTERSSLVGASLERLRVRDHYAVNVLAVNRGGQRIVLPLRRLRFQTGDVVVLEGHVDAVPQAMGELQLLPLAERKVRLGKTNSALIPAALLICAMVLVAFQLVPVTIAFFGAAVGVVALGSLSLRDAYDAIDWPILVLLGALIPVSDSLRETGGTDLIAGLLSHIAEGAPAYATLALVMVTAMLVTPFLNNAATVLVMAPVAAGFAQNLGLNPDPFLMAVAVGAASDFLTPIGHQCNTLVMGPGCYGFGDYWKLGLPLSILVIVVGTLLIMTFWPL